MPVAYIALDCCHASEACNYQPIMKPAIELLQPIVKSIYKSQLILLQKYKTHMECTLKHVVIAEMEISDQQKLGVGLGGFGVFFLLLGILMLFDKGLLAIGNLFCIAGFVLCVGFERTGRFFGQVERLKGTACFLGGIFILLLGWPVIGILMEAYGFVALFGGFMPMVSQ